MRSMVHEAAGRHPLANPVVIAVVLLASGLLVVSIAYGDYFVHFLLGPATVALAVPLYRQFALVRRSALVAVVSAVTGGTFAATAGVGIAPGAEPGAGRGLAPVRRGASRPGNGGRTALREGPAGHVVIRALGLLLLLPGVALAQPDARTGLGGAEARQAVDGAAAPWTSLVRVQSEAGGQCTGVLVAPDLVLTAAHCLLASRTRAWVRPERVNVLAGYYRGEFHGHAVAAYYRTGAFDPLAGGPRGADWAVLRLTAPLPAPALPVAPAVPGAEAMLGGWQRDRAHALLADTGCRVEAVVRDAGRPLLRHDCAATRGSSGAPLLVRLGAGWAVAGVQSAQLREGRGGVAVPAATIPLE